MRKVLPLLALTAAASAASLQAQMAAPVNTRVVQAQGALGKWSVPECGLDKGNFMIGSGGTYLKSASEQSDPEKQARLAGQGKSVLIEGIQKGQAGASGAWYYLGRAYLYLGDLAGADSALTRAETLAPACAAEIQKLRRNTWIPLLNAGVTFVKSENNDSAMILFRQADQIYRSEPNAYVNQGVLFNKMGQNDSAIVYFQKAVTASGSDPKAAEGRDNAQYSLAALLTNAGRYKEAVAAWQQYLQWKPDDLDAKKAYARALRADGQPDAAAAIERELLSGAAGEVSTADLMNAGANFFRDKNYTEAVDMYGRVVAREPWNREALFWQANSYLGLQNGPELVKAAKALYALDPMNENSVTMLAAGYQIVKDQPARLKTNAELFAMPFSLTVDQFNLQQGGARVTGTAVGRKAVTIEDKAIAPHPVTLVFEFLNKDMGVVAQSERTVPALGVGEKAAVEAEGLGEGIVGWRYHAK